jgi:hypothetical protein
MPSEGIVCCCQASGGRTDCPRLFVNRLAPIGLGQPGHQAVLQLRIAPSAALEGIDPRFTEAVTS